MINEADYVRVKGDFVMDSLYSHSGSLTAGTLEVRGDFTQKSSQYDLSFNTWENFHASGTHKVILSGTTPQTVHFDNPGTSQSHFNILEIANPSVVFATPLVAIELDSNGYDLHSITITETSWTLQENAVVNGALTLMNSTLDLNGFQLTVKSNLNHSGGTLDVNGGKLVIEGDYRIQRIQGEYGAGTLSMTNSADYVRVKGDFVMESRTDHNGYLTAGTLKVGGDFTQKSPYGFSVASFHASGTHKVTLSGTAQQTVHFDDPGYSRFNILENSNTSGEALIFSSAFNALEFHSNGHELSPMTVQTMDWNLQEDTVINGDLALNGSILDLNGYQLTVKSNLSHSAGTLEVNGGNLVIEGDYWIQGGYFSGILSMTNSADYVRVNGDFVMESDYSHSGFLTAGTLEVGGDFTQKNSSSHANFYASGTHKVILSGTAQQTVHFEDPSYSRFNILEVMNGSLDGIIFETPLNVFELRSHAHALNSITIQSMNWTLYEDTVIDGELTLEGNTLNLNGFQLTVKSNLTCAALYSLDSTLDINGGTLVVEGDLICSGSTLDVNGGTLIVERDLIHSDGTLDMNGGNLVVEGDYRIQNTTGYSKGRLMMTDTSDYILVKGCFVMDSDYDHSSYLTAGTLEVWGDFTQKSSSRGYANFYASGTHKVILSGMAQQTVSFEDPGSSRFNILENRNTSGEALIFSSVFNALEFRNYVHELSSITTQSMNWTLYENTVIDGALTLNGSILNLNGHQLTVQSNLIHSGDTLDVNGGTLILQGDLTHSGAAR